jgi:hypothetical protein
MFTISRNLLDLETKGLLRYRNTILRYLLALNAKGFVRLNYDTTVFENDLRSLSLPAHGSRDRLRIYKVLRQPRRCPITKQ